MRGLLALFVIALIHGSYASLLLQGPSEVVLQGSTVTLECLVSDPELNTSQVHFERFSKYMQSWYRLEPETSYFRRRCLYDYINVQREEQRISLSIPYVTSYAEGSYRCVSDAVNITATANSSQTLTFKVHYMGEPLLYRSGLSRYLGSVQDLKVSLGEDVTVDCSASSSQKPEYFWQKEGGDWILPSSKLTLKKVTALDGGEYTCTAQHPSVSSLTKKRTISITVLPEDAPWYESTNMQITLITAAVALTLLVLMVFMTVFLCRRAKQAKTSKGPIDDRSQKKPIYKNSVESLPSTCGDKQPLV
ncbi:uncharacterized protein LOC115374146 [Myripristis murdjan]|uniref:Si:ch211-79k12.1 n=1 Tax=Myripristis murdjan TaxID=586833 RepID=A0A667YG43_9TELE|nr:uncharacterized protein LOC115374146 [Myripristis murdjan]